MTTRLHAATLMMVLCGALLGVTEWTFAEDLNPPPYRGGFRSTVAEWDFDEDGTNPLLPDGDLPTVVGDFAPQLDAAFPAGAPHPSGFANSNLTYTGSGFLNEGEVNRNLSFNVPNWIDQEPYKFLRLQVTYTGTTPGTTVFGVLGAPGETDSVDEVLLDTVFGTAGNSLYFYQDWELRPNPDWDQVVLFVPPGTFIDQVVIDTISTPEPSSIALAAIMALSALGWKARRRRTAA